MVAGRHQQVAQLVHRDAEVFDLVVVEAGTTGGVGCHEADGAQVLGERRHGQPHVVTHDLQVSWIPASMLSVPSWPEPAVASIPGPCGSEISGRAYAGGAYAQRHMPNPPVTVTFPATPEYLRLARLATADAASRAGLDYEEVDDVRIAVSELCSLVSLDAAASVTLSFVTADGR